MWSLIPTLCQKEYKNLLDQLLRIGLPGWTLEPLQNIGLLCVAKDGGKEVAAHCGCEAPRSGKVGRACDMDSELNVGWNRGHAAIHIRQVDVRDCVHRLWIKLWLGRKFCLPPVSARSSTKWRSWARESKRAQKAGHSSRSFLWDSLGRCPRHGCSCTSPIFSHGTELDGKKMSTRFTQKVTGWIFECSLVHLAWEGLCQRGFLSIFCTV